VTGTRNDGILKQIMPPKPPMVSKNLTEQKDAGYLKMTKSLLITLSIVLSYSQISGRIYSQALPSHRSMETLTARYFKNSNNPSVAMEFFSAFLKLPSNERVDLWLRDTKRSYLTEGNIRDVMIIHCLDTIPDLMDIVRNRKGEDRLLALHLLVDMERFVPLKDLPLKIEFGKIRDWSAENSKDMGRKGGILSLRTPIDGKRIGSQAKDLIYWAANLSEDQDLRFHGRDQSGLLYEDLKSLRLDELIERWKTAISKLGKRRGYFYYSDETVLIENIERILMENVNAVVPAMARILAEDRNAYIRDSAFFFLYQADIYGMRLRRSLAGQRAIGVMRQAMQAKMLRPENCTQNARYSIWQGFVGQAFGDKTMLGDATFLSVIAMAFEQYYGENATLLFDSQIPAKANALNPEMKRFVTHLTLVDPSFPSWEFTLTGMSGYEAILHPRFKQKIERYHECWKNFKANHFVISEEKLDPEVLKLKLPIDEPSKK
jgi:hypothetical protein